MFRNSRPKMKFTTDQGEACRLEYLHNGAVSDDGQQVESETSQRLRFRFEAVPMASKEFVEKLFWGKVKLDELPPADPTTVRVYLCSGTTDMEAERNAIHEEVVPLLRDYCRTFHGMEFQLVDPKWGVPESNLNDPWTRDLCLSELDRCIEDSVGPSFAIVIGVKNGSRLPPSEIPQNTFETIRTFLEEGGNDVALLDKWYMKNSNTTPSAYLLQPMLAHGDNPPESWRDYREELVHLIDAGADDALCRLKLSKEKAVKLTESMLSAELFRGFEKLRIMGKCASEQCLAIIRTLRGVKDNLLSKDVGKYIDENSSSGQIDSMAFQEALNWCTERIPKVVRNTDNLKKTALSWNDLQTNNNDQLNSHISEISGFFYDTLRRLIDQFAEEKENRAQDGLITEVIEHWSIVSKVTAFTQCRNDTMGVVQGYLGSVETDQPLILVGQSGVGKTVLAAQIAASIQTLSSKLFPGLQNSVVVRFLGSTCRSRTLQQFLFSLCQQLMFIMGKQLKVIPQDCEKLKKLFFELVTKAEFSGIMVLIIDGLERLCAKNGLLDVDWLPSRIVNNMKIVITVRQESTEILQKLASNIESGNMLRVDPVGAVQCSEILKAWMKNEERTITIEQWKCVLDTIRHGAKPLFLKLLFRHLLSWKSFDCIGSSQLPRTVETAMDSYFCQLEDRHGSLVCRKILAYLTATEYGLTEAELIDILSLDEECSNHLEKKDAMVLRRFPELYWYRIRQDLEPFLDTKEMDGVAVLTWADKQLRDVAQERYLHGVDFRRAVFSTLSVYFTGPRDREQRESEQEYQVQGSALTELSCLSPNSGLQAQPMILSNGELAVRFNLRKLRFLPICLSSAGLFDILKRDVLCNFDWIRARVTASSFDDLFLDYSIFRDKETQFVCDALRMSVESLANDIKALGAELTGRLLPQSRKYPHIQTLIRQCDLAAQTYCPLVPNYQVYASPGGPMHSECVIVNPPIVGEAGQICCFRSPEGLLVTYSHSVNHRLKMWNLSLQEEVKGIHVPPGVVYSSRSGREICVVNDNKTVCVYKTDSGEQQCEMKCDQEMKEFAVGNKYFAFTTKKGTGPTVVEMDTGAVVHKLSYHCRTLAISSEDDYILCNSQSTIYLYSLPLLERKLVIQAEDIPVRMTFFISFRRFLVLSKDFKLTQYIYDPVFKSYSSVVLLRDLRILDYVFSAEEDLVLVRSSHCLRIIETRAGKVLHALDDFPTGVFLDHTTHFTGAGFTPDSRLVIASRYTYLCVWCACSGQPLRILLSATSPIERLFLANSLYMAVSLQQNGTIQVWNLNSLDENIKLSNAVIQSPVVSLALCVESRVIICCGENAPEAKLVDMNSGDVKTTFQHGDANTELCGVALSPNGRFAVTCSTGTNNEFDDVYSVYSEMDTNEGDSSILREAILWDCRTGRKVYHALNNRDVVFSDNSVVVCFITRVSPGNLEFSGYSSYAAVALSLTSRKERYLELPVSAEFVCKPFLLLSNSGDYSNDESHRRLLISVMQISRARLPGPSEVAGFVLASDVRVVVSNLHDEEEKYNSLLRIQNLWERAENSDQIIDARAMPDGYVLFTYCKGLEFPNFDLGQDGQVVLPNESPKGAFIYDFQKECVLKHFPSFLATDSILASSRFSQTFGIAMDNGLNVFIIPTGQEIKSAVHRLAPEHTCLALDGKYLVGLTINRQRVVVIRSSDGVMKGQVFVHGRGTALSVGEDDRTVAVGCDDGRIMVFSLILELCDPVREFIEKLPSRRRRDEETDLLAKDVRRISSSHSELSRLSATIRQNRLSNLQRPPSYKILSTAAEVVKNYNRQHNSQTCCIQ